MQRAHTRYSLQRERELRESPLDKKKGTDELRDELADEMLNYREP